MDYFLTSLLPPQSSYSSPIGRHFSQSVTRGIFLFLILSSYLGLICCFFGYFSPALADQKPERGDAPVDVVVLVDSSASMRLSDPDQLRKQAVSTFVSTLGPKDRIAIAEFSEAAQIRAPFESAGSSQTLGEHIKSLGDSGEFTDILAAINVGAELFRAKGRPIARKLMILLSDGKMDPSPRKYSPSEATAKLVGEILPEVKRAGIEVHTIALGGESDRELMSQIAQVTDGVGWYASDPGALANLLREILKNGKGPTDSGLRAQRILSFEDRLEEVIIYVKRTPGSLISIVSPEGERYSGRESPREGIKWFQNEEFVLLAVSEPPTGDWIVDGLRDPDQFVAFFTDLKATVRWPSALFIGSEAVIEAVLIEGSRPISIPALSRAIRASVQVVSTDRVAEPMVSGEMVDDGTLGDLITEDGVFSRQAIVQELGNFKVSVTLRGPFFERSAQQSFFVSPVLMRSAIELYEHPFSTLVKDYKEPEGGEHGDHAGHGGSAHGSHGAGEHDEQAMENDGGIANGTEMPTEEEAPHHQKEQAPDEGGGGHQHENNEHDAKGFPVVRVELEQKVLSYKKYEVRVTVVDSEGREYPVPLYRSVSSDTVLFGNLADLPERGLYRAQARLRVKKKLASEQQYFGPWLPFELKESTSPTLPQHKEEVTHAEHDTETGDGFLLSLSVVTLFNLILGGWMGVVIRRRASLVQSEQLSYSYLEALEAVVSQLEQIASESQIALDDPRLMPGTQSISGDSARRESSGTPQTAE